LNENRRSVNVFEGRGDSQTVHCPPAYIDQPAVADGNLATARARTWHDNVPLMRQFTKMLNSRL